MYQVLARKYRPKNFYELVGQQHVSKALTSALERGRLHHAYLFTGTRGVGKTTIARILAKCLNCETGITATPCEQCNVCQAVNEGRFIDLIEIDAASRTKVEDTRELLDNVPYAPTQGRFKVYLIDEVHMLSTHSFNALLKTLEEPPEHVKFLFATTDPQKLPITVVSRCLQFTLRPLTVDEIQQHLQNILQKESIHHEASALWQLAESAQGSLRDALSLTDQAIAYGQGAIYQQDVKEMLGLIDKHLVYDLLLAIHQNQRQWVAELLLLFRQQSIDVAMVLDQLISTLHELALMQYLPNLALNYSDEINQKVQQLAQNISAQDLQLYYQIACKGRDELNLAVTQEQGFEMCILRLLAFRPLAVNELTPIEHQAIEQKKTQSHEIYQQAQVESTLNESLTENHDVEAQNESVSNESLIENHQVEVQSLTEYSEKATQAQVSSPISVDNLSSYAQDERFVIFNQDDLIDVLQGELKVHVSEIVPTSQGLIIFNGLQDLFGLADIGDVSTLTQEHDIQLNKLDVAQHQDLPHYQDLSYHQAVDGQQNPPVLSTSLQHQEELTVQTSQLSQNPSEQTPQQILALPVQPLTGQWTAEKWEYWLRNSPLSPAVQGLLQDGMMMGEIVGASVLHIPAHYQPMLQGFLANVEQALKTIDAKNNLQVVWQLDEQAMTPLRLQQQREIQAHQQAMCWLHQHQGIANFIQTFSGQLRDIDLGVKS